MTTEELTVSLVGDVDDFIQAMNDAEGQARETARVAEENAQALQEMMDVLEAGAAVTQSVITPLEAYQEEMKQLDFLLEKGAISEDVYNRKLEQTWNTLPKVRQAQEQMNSALQEASRITKAAMTPMDQYLEEMKKLDALYDQGHISQETYNRTLEKTWNNLPKVRKAQEDAKRAMEQSNAELQKTIQLYEKEMQAAAAVTQSVITPTERYSQEQKKLEGMVRRGFISQETYNRAIANLNATLPQVPSKLAQVNAQMMKLGRNTQWAGQQITSTSRMVQSWGTHLTLGITTPVIAMGVAGVKAFGDFERGVKSVEMATNITAAQVRQLEVAAMAMSKELGQGPTLVVSAFGELAKAGVELNTVLTSAGRTAVQFAKVGELEAATAAVVLADAMKVFGEESDVAANLLSAAADSSSTSIRGITEAFSQVSAVAGSANQSLRDAAAAIAVLANNGIKGSDAGTSLKTMLLRLMAPADKAADVISKYNLQVRDATGQMKPMAEIIGELQKKMGHLGQEALDNALFDLFGQDAIRAAQVFMREGVDGFNAMTDAMSGALPVAEKYEGLMNTLWGSVERLWASIQRAAIGIGARLAPMLSWLATQVEKLLEWWDKLDAGTQNVILVVAALAAAVGPMLVVLGGAGAAVGALVAGLGALLSVGLPTLGLAAAIAAGFVVTTVEVLAVAAAVGALIYNLVGPDSLAEAWNTVMTYAMAFTKNTAGFLYNFSHNWQALMKWIPQNWHLVLSDMQGMMLNHIKNMVSNVMVGIRTIFRIWTAWRGWMYGLLSKLFTVEFVNLVAKGLIKVAVMFQNFATNAWNVIKSVFTGRGGSMKGFIDQMNKDFAAGASDMNFMDTVKNILEEESGNLQINPFKDFESAIKEGPDFKFDFGTPLVEAAEEAGKEAGKTMAQAVEDGWYDWRKEKDKATMSPQEFADLYGLGEVEELTKEQKKALTDIAKAKKKADDEAIAAGTKEAEQAARLIKAEEDAAKALVNKHNPAKKLAEEQDKLNSMFRKGLIPLDVYNKEMAELKAKMDDATKAKEKIAAGGFDSVMAGTHEAFLKTQDFFALRKMQAHDPLPGFPHLKLGAGWDKIPAVDPRAEKKGAVPADKTTETLLNKIAENTKPRPVYVLEPANI